MAKPSVIYDPKVNPLRIVTSEIRGNWVYVMEPVERERDDGEKFFEYAMEMIIDDQDTIDAINSVVKHLIKTEFGGKKPRGFKHPLHDGSERAPDEDDEDVSDKEWEDYRDTYEGKSYITVRCGVKRPPNVVRLNPKERVESSGEIKSGDYFRVGITGAAFDSKAGGKGAKFWLNNVQFLRPGKQLGMVIASATDDFEDLTEEYGADYNNDDENNDEDIL